jgi:hypothetical protein
MATIRKLEVVSPVPADIDVANSVKPLPVTAIAEELGLHPAEYDCYGKSKAKVSQEPIAMATSTMRVLRTLLLCFCPQPDHHLWLCQIISYAGF